MKLLQITIGCSLVSLSISSIIGKRGIDPIKLVKYDENIDGRWRCLNNLHLINVDQINDDFCDCGDGSDEPGTGK